jgi:hypothetical protein
MNDQQLEIVPALQALTDEARAEVHRQAAATRAAYGVPVAQRTDEEQALVDAHESWKGEL